MTATVYLGGSGTYVDDDTLERIDELASLLTDYMSSAIEFDMQDSDKITAEFDSVSKAEDVLEIVLDERACPLEVLKFMKKENLRFEKVEFETDWADKE